MNHWTPKHLELPWKIKIHDICPNQFSIYDILGITYYERENIWEYISGWWFQT
jgi:hypothetical protein